MNALITHIEDYAGPICRRWDVSLEPVYQGSIQIVEIRPLSMLDANIYCTVGLSRFAGHDFLLLAHRKQQEEARRMLLSATLADFDAPARCGETLNTGDRLCYVMHSPLFSEHQKMKSRDPARRMYLLIPLTVNDAEKLGGMELNDAMSILDNTGADLWDLDRNEDL